MKHLRTAIENVDRPASSLVVPLDKVLNETAYTFEWLDW